MVKMMLLASSGDYQIVDTGRKPSPGEGKI